MRFFSVFFACYLTLLACLPCADAAPVAGAGPGVALVKARPTENAPLDWCTPLCQCACCAGTLLPAALTVAFSPAAPVLGGLPRFARLVPPAVRQRAGAVWQPPRAWLSVS